MVEPMSPAPLQHPSIYIPQTVSKCSNMPLFYQSYDPWDDAGGTFAVAFSAQASGFNFHYQLFAMLRQQP